MLHQNYVYCPLVIAKSREASDLGTSLFALMVAYTHQYMEIYGNKWYSEMGGWAPRELFNNMWQQSWADKNETKARTGHHEWKPKRQQRPLSAHIYWH